MSILRESPIVFIVEKFGSHLDEYGLDFILHDPVVRIVEYNVSSPLVFLKVCCIDASEDVFFTDESLWLNALKVNWQKDGF